MRIIKSSINKRTTDVLAGAYKQDDSIIIDAEDLRGKSREEIEEILKDAPVGSEIIHIRNTSNRFNIDTIIEKQQHYSSNYHQGFSSPHDWKTLNEFWAVGGKEYPYIDKTIYEAVNGKNKYYGLTSDVLKAHGIDQPIDESTSVEASDSYNLDDETYKYVTNVDGYWIYRAIVDGKGVWRAMTQGSNESQFEELSFPISYDQARGFEPIDEPSAITKLRKDLGKKLLPKAGQSIKATRNKNSSVRLQMKEELMDQILPEIKSKLKEIMTSPKFGFPEDEVDDYSGADIYLNNDGYFVVTVYAEVSYSGLVKLMDALNPIVEKYDRDAYFDAETSGRCSAYIDPNNIPKKMYPKYDVFQNNSSNTVEGSQDISRYDKEIVSYQKIISKSVEDNDGFLTDYTMYEVVTEDGSVEYECYFGDNDLYGPWNGEGLDFETDNYDEAVEWYNSYSSDKIQSSDEIQSDKITGASKEVELDPEESMIDMNIDQYIIVDSEGSWNYDSENYDWASSDGEGSDWYSETGVRLDDPTGVVEKIDELIEPHIPIEPGTYRVQGYIELYYTVSGVYENRYDYTSDDYSSDINSDFGSAEYNKKLSKIEDVKVTKI